MDPILFLSDVVLDPVIKEIRSLSGGQLTIEAAYEDDLVLKLLSSQADELSKYELIFIHSDQVFHEKDIAWQKAFFEAVSGISRKFGKNILLSNAFSRAYAFSPLKYTFGKGYDNAFTYADELKHVLQHSNIYIFDFTSLYTAVGTSNFYNYSLGHLYQMPYTKPAIKQIAAEFYDQYNFLSSEEKKVIVLDCDNTLWKGIIGEDGIDGIFCDKNVEGIIHYHLQSFLKTKKEEGFLLCICSKNNEQEVKEAFEKKNFPLHWNDFIIKKVNWNDKVDNLGQISRELNVGINSLIFIDDNLFELNSIKELLKGVACFHLTDNFNDLLAITNSFLFRRKLILKEDIEKTKQYESEQQRKDSEGSFSSLDDFIKSLNIVMDIRVNDMPDLPRLSQMTGKTNQFNFNKHSYSEDEMRSFADKGRIYSLKVADKYGDYGTVGLIMVELNGNEAIMENYLMSCRALGKKIEYRFYDHVLSHLAGEGFEIKEIRFTTNDRNIPAQTFLKSINHASSTH